MPDPCWTSIATREMMEPFRAEGSNRDVASSSLGCPGDEDAGSNASSSGACPSCEVCWLEPSDDIVMSGAERIWTSETAAEMSGMYRHRVGAEKPSPSAWATSCWRRKVWFQ